MEEKEEFKRKFWWPALIGILYPILLMALYFLPMFITSEPIYINEAGDVAQNMTVYDLIYRRTGTTVIFVFIGITWLAYIGLFLCASLLPKFRQFRFFNIIFGPLLGASIILSILLFTIMMRDIDAADAAYRIANLPKKDRNGSSLYHFASVFFWLDMLLPAFFAAWWGLVCLFSIKRYKNENKTLNN